MFQKGLAFVQATGLVGGSCRIFSNEQKKSDYLRTSDQTRPFAARVPFPSQLSIIHHLPER